MERNPNEGFGTSESDESGTTGAGLGGSDGAAAPSTSSTSGAGYDGGFGTTADRGATTGARTGTSTADDTRDRLHQAKGKAAEKLGQVRERAGELKATLADKLDAGADRLRQRAADTGGKYSPPMAAAGVDTGTTEVAAGREPMPQVSDKVASGMKSTADWLRNHDLDSMRSEVEEQVRTNPGRSLLIAAVAGYVLGKAFRR
ncbi:MAG: hypothetical protein M3373_03130 [Gemmatimonadota bacterium]|nr:hypothetical protein [Gemmatimonadota bacterium]